MTSVTLRHPWLEPPRAGEAIAVAPGVLWVRMPLPFQLDHINVWLLEDGPNWTVVDTGVGLPDVRELWRKLFASYLGGRPVTRVIVTHFHPDHMGNAGWLLEHWPADLWCTQAEWLTAGVFWRSRDADDLETRLSHFRRNGGGEDALARIRERGHHYPKLVPTLPTQYRRLCDGDCLEIGRRRWRLVTGGGHSPEHASLAAPEDGMLISGDQVLPKISTNVSVLWDQPRANPLRLYLESLDRFSVLPQESLVLPSHGLPFAGLHERVAALRRHHAARLSETLDALAREKSAAELLPLLFRRELDTHQIGFAMGEALAHLHYLEAEGRATRRVSADGVHRFSRA